MSSALMPTYSPPDIVFEKGNGSFLYTQDGTRYLDFISGIAVTSFGHNHPHLVRTLKEQAEKFWHCSNMFKVEHGERLAQRLVDNSFADKVFFANSGAEAVECGLKMMRRYHFDKGDVSRNRIIGMKSAFHGRTMATVAAAGNPTHCKGFFTGDQGFDQVQFGDIDALKKAITEQTAGIILEPVQGEGGVIPASPEYMQAVRQLCDENGILMMLDEVQSGMGRTGQLFAYQISDIEPDILASAKGLGGGFPIGACLAKEEFASCMVVGTHGTTFGGNPLATSVANAVLDLLLEDGMMATIQLRSALLRDKLQKLSTNHPDLFDGVQGAGFMVGLKCKVPNADMLVALRDQGLLVGRAGTDIVRLLPPLNVSIPEIEEAISIMDRACADWKALEQAS